MESFLTIHPFFIFSIVYLTGGGSLTRMGGFFIEKGSDGSGIRLFGNGRRGLHFGLNGNAAYPEDLFVP